MASVAQLAPVEPVIPQTAGARLKQRLAESRATLRSRYLENNSAAELLREHRELVDGLLRSVWQIGRAHV